MKGVIELVCVIFFCVSSSIAQNYSNQIDTVLMDQYKLAKVQPNSIISDDDFVKRAYLTIIGRIPTYFEYESFNKIQVKDKRKRLIDFLINHPGFVSSQYNYWANSLRLRERLSPINNFNGIPYIEYIKNSIAQNKPYNIFVRDLLLSSGSYYDNPATGYYYRDYGMPLDNLIATFKVFAGTDISCAQCHDDPFQDISQMQFYEMAAFFPQIVLNKTSTEYNAKLKMLRTDVEALIKEDPEKNRGLNNRLNNFLRATQASVILDNSRTLKLPHDYQYSDGKPNSTVSAKTLDGKVLPKSEDLRVDAVNWLTSSKHPTFTKNFVNRMWCQIFGQYIIREYDNIQDSSKLNSPLLNLLSSIFIKINYDTKEFIRILCKTQLFERALYEGQNANSSRFVFIGPVQRRLTAEQLWDSTLALVVELPEKYRTNFDSEYVKTMKIDIEDINVENVKNRVDQYNTVIRNKYTDAPKYKNLTLVRASEINDTSAMNTILEQLGRSDRELIDTSSTEGSVTQVISFMNGQIVDIASSETGYLFERIRNKTPNEQVEILFKAILCRPSTVREKSMLANVSEKDAIWTLINTTEFKFYK